MLPMPSGRVVSKQACQQDGLPTLVRRADAVLAAVTYTLLKTDWPGCGGGLLRPQVYQHHGRARGTLYGPHTTTLLTLPHRFHWAHTR